MTIIQDVNLKTMMLEDVDRAESDINVPVHCIFLDKEIGPGCNQFGSFSVFPMLRRDGRYLITLAGMDYIDGAENNSSLENFFIGLSIVDKKNLATDLMKWKELLSSGQTITSLKEAFIDRIEE